VPVPLAQRFGGVAVLPQLGEVGTGQGVGGGLDPRARGLRGRDCLDQARQVVGVREAVAHQQDADGVGLVGRGGRIRLGLGGGRAGGEKRRGQEQACEDVHISSWAWLWLQRSTLPGLRIPSGSNSCLTPRIRASASGPRACAMKSRLARPMPCSPESVPRSSRVSAKTRGRAVLAARAWDGSSGSNRMLTCRLPLPAWPKVTIGTPQSREMACTPATSAGIRDTGTTTSSLILPAAMVRSDGDSALRADHSR